MNRLAKWTMRLYPASWRARYGDELDALVSDAGTDVHVVADLLKGGVRMQFKTWSFPALALTLGIVGAVLGTGIGLLIPSQYTSKARLLVTPARLGESEAGSPMIALLNGLIQQAEMSVRRRNSLSALIQNPRLDLYADERRVAPLEDVIEEMRAQINIQPVAWGGGPDKHAVAFDISFTYPERLKAQQTVQEIVSIVQSELQQESAKPYRGQNFNRVLVVNVASLPVSPASHGKLTAMFEGLGFAILIASISRMIRHTGFIARRFVPVCVAFGIAGLSLVIVADELDIVPYQYQSVATVQLPATDSERQTRELLTSVLDPEVFSLLIGDPHLHLYQNQVRTQPFEDVIQTMKRHLDITLSHPGGLNWLNISFIYPDRFKARQTVQMIVEKLFSADLRMHPGMISPPVSPPFVIDVLDKPSLPVTPVSPNRYRHAAFGCLWGVIAAAVIALVRRRWKPEEPASA